MHHEPAPPAPSPEELVYRSIGIDIGSSTTHFVVSRLRLRRLGIALSSRYVVLERRIIYRSPILFTPYVNQSRRIDVVALTRFFRANYRRAGLEPERIDSGALIVTGEAARKVNAPRIAELFAAQAGRFVCATAGPNLEAIIAAHGANAVARSLGNGEPARTVMNVDVGGGSTKVAIARDGTVVATAAINLGSRLVAYDRGGRITRLEAAGRRIAAACGFRLRLGEPLRQGRRRALAEKQAALLAEFLGRRKLSRLARALLLTPPFRWDQPLDAVMFSGGVGEYIYEREHRRFGDLGPELGQSIRQQLDDGRLVDAPLRVPVQRIRATVIGASQHTVQVSGSTVHISHPAVLPLRNLKVVPVAVGAQPLSRPGLSALIRAAVRRFDLEHASARFAVALRGSFPPRYAAIEALARGLVQGTTATHASDEPLVVITQLDLARLLGRRLADLLPARPIVSIDGIELGDLDYVDIGQPFPKGDTVPVVVKSLVFRGRSSVAQA